MFRFKKHIGIKRAVWLLLICFIMIASLGVNHIVGKASGLTVQNNSFESVDGSGLPLNWTRLGDNTGFITGSTTRAYDGTRSIKICDTNSSQDALARSIQVTVNEGSFCSASVYCYLEKW